MKRIVIIALTACTFGAPAKGQEHESNTRAYIELAGKWKFRIDSTDRGLKESWQHSVFTEEVKLPGSMEENGKGRRVEKATTQYLNQVWQYTGAAWYQKEIDVPASWQGRPVELFLERTKAAWVWVDGEFAGNSSLLSAPQVYRLGNRLQPGKHTLTIMVNNSLKLLPVGGSHALSEHTQSNWNGIIGRMFLQAADDLQIGGIKITPNVKERLVSVAVSILNHQHVSQTAHVELQATAWNNQHTVKPLSFAVQLQGRDTVLQFTYPLGHQVQRWSEYTPAIYRLNVTLRGTKAKDNLSTGFGLREFKAAGTQFRVNDVVTFLRGKNESCIFPLTGYPPTDTASWRKLYRMARSYGINHYRFHSYTPPHAAFEAADAEGIYIQAELPNWADLTLKDTFRTSFLYHEGKAILDAYGNHPSFVMFSLGNELGGDKAVHNKLVKDLRAHDGRLLFAHGTNAFYADPAPGETDDFWVTMRTGKESPQREYDIRGSFATTEDVGNGMLNTFPPSTRRNFSAAIRGAKLPVVGHETGQYQVYPDYSEIPKYKGVLKPANFEIFRQRLQQAGMGRQARDFFRASGMLTALLYREEIEMAFRTPGFGGFQLLDLQDFPGQGTALVGLLNAFMESKGLVEGADFRRFNNDVVIQLLMDKYTYANNERYTADVRLVNYSPAGIRQKSLHWKAVTAAGKVIAKGSFNITLAESGKINNAGNISFPLGNISEATKLLIRLDVAGAYQAEYPVWVYPRNIDTAHNTAIKVATAVTDEVIETLNGGGRVLLFPDHGAVKNNSVAPQFITEFWNWLVFKGGAERQKRPVSAGTLGILTDPAHSLFSHFPTEFHTNWQWWHIVKNTRPLILDKTDTAYTPIVQVIDNIDRNHKLGMLFEFKAGKGKLFVSMANLPAILHQPEARQLYHSIMQYMRSAHFDPQTSINFTQLKEILYQQ